jgi:hypothetical protein
MTACQQKGIAVQSSMIYSQLSSTHSGQKAAKAAECSEAAHPIKISKEQVPEGE